MNGSLANNQASLRKTAFQFVVLMGMVSLCADVTYQGARGIYGPFFLGLGASATAVGAVAGLGETIGYVMRLLSGYASDRTRRYWTVAFVGYAVNLLAVPLLALAQTWQTAAGLILAERIGKATRVPARDAMLSHATKHTGHGVGFGLHKALDQIGAMGGPLLIWAVLVFRPEGYRTGFAVLLVPALVALALLMRARLLYGKTTEIEIKAVRLESKGLTRPFWLYVAATALIAAAYAHWPLIAYHFGKIGVAGGQTVSLLYALAMAVGAVAAMSFGWLFDRVGIAALIAATALSAFFPPLVFSHSLTLALVGVCLWGVGMGSQESVMRAVIARMAPADKRGSAYGLFNVVFGLAWGAGSVVLGALYDASDNISFAPLIIFSVMLQLAAIPLLLRLSRTSG